MAEFKFEIIENLGRLSTKSNNWTKELNIVKWSDYEPKYDIREWNPDHTRMSKGVTFTEEEIRILHSLLEEEIKNLDE
ncbi:MAG: PC4/YdbC family ssDNA-binding protein [Finegoldia sp.]|nr:PC4/YdbC family ssDNA-binding protein [Finegoldia sp.]